MSGAEASSKRCSEIWQPTETRHDVVVHEGRVPEHRCLETSYLNWLNVALAWSSAIASRRGTLTRQHVRPFAQPIEEMYSGLLYISIIARVCVQGRRGGGSGPEAQGVTFLVCVQKHCYHWSD
jgi:hypothetical protein